MLFVCLSASSAVIGNPPARWLLHANPTLTNLTSERSLGRTDLSPRSQRGSWAQACCPSPSPGPQPRLTLREAGWSGRVRRRRRCSGSGKRPVRHLSLRPPPSSPPLPGDGSSQVSDERGLRGTVCLLLRLRLLLPQILSSSLRAGDADLRGGACQR